MTYTQSSFSQDNNTDMFVAVRPKKASARKTVCIPEAIPSAAMRPAGKAAEMPAPFTFVCIFLLCVAMLFLLINSFSAIQEAAVSMTDIQKELNDLKQTEAVVQAQLNEKYAGIDLESSAKELGMISAENTPLIPLDDADSTNRETESAAYAAFVASWNLRFAELLSYLK